jgi:hypothetical protein
MSKQSAKSAQRKSKPRTTEPKSTVYALFAPSEPVLRVDRVRDADREAYNEATEAWDDDQYHNREAAEPMTVEEARKLFTSWLKALDHPDTFEPEPEEE